MRRIGFADLGCDAVSLQQAAMLQQSGRIRRSLGGQVDPDEDMGRFAIEDCVFDIFVRVGDLLEL